MTIKRFFWKPVFFALLVSLAACTTGRDSQMRGFSLSDEPLIGKFVWHDLITDDVEASREFYGNLFGWTFENTTRPNGGDYTLILHEGRFLGGIVYMKDPESSNFSRWLGYLSVPDVDVAVRQTESAGGKALIGPLDVGSVGRAAAIRDPQGAVLGLLRSRQGDPDDSQTSVAGHIIWNELLAADDQTAKHFYSQLTGLQARAQQRKGGEYTVLHANGMERAGIQPRPGDDIDPVWLTFFAVSDPVSAASKVTDLGGEILLPPSDELRDGSIALVADPTGALLALQKLEQ